MRAPDVSALRQLSAASIKAALTGGSMSTQGQRLSAAEVDAVSRFLGTNSASVASEPGQKDFARRTSIKSKEAPGSWLVSNAALGPSRCLAA
jgi:hypothetical protein